jgi:hypothetical protein
LRWNTIAFAPGIKYLTTTHRDGKRIILKFEAGFLENRLQGPGQVSIGPLGSGDFGIVDNRRAIVS